MLVTAAMTKILQKIMYSPVFSAIPLRFLQALGYPVKNVISKEMGMKISHYYALSVRTTHSHF